MKIFHTLILLLVALLTAIPAPFAAPITFTIDTARDNHPISAYIYGHNSSEMFEADHNLPLFRSGGNRWTAYNWETNASNAGSDWFHSNDSFLGGGDTPGEAIAQRLRTVFATGASAIVTVPIQGHVAADKDGSVPAGTPILDRFQVSLADKPGALLLNPNRVDDTIYQDEFVNWAEHTFFPNGRSTTANQIIYSLDNEPALWASTHARIQPSKVTYQELRDKSIAFATMIKDVTPEALVIGPVLYTADTDPLAPRQPAGLKILRMDG